MFSFANKKQKIVVVGSGYWGSIIINTLIGLGFKNIIIYDKSIKNKKIAKKKFKTIKFENNFSNILDDKNILNIFVVTPPSVNLTIVKKLIFYNKNIFLEKPGFSNVKDINKIENYLKKSKSKLMFGYIYYYNSYIDKIKTILDKKILGEIQYSLLKKNISDISNLHLKLKNINIDINNSWLNPNKERLIKIIGKKKMLSFDELDLEAPIKIYNQYAKYPKLDFFDKKFLKSKALIYLGKSKSIKLKTESPLINEIKSFFDYKKPHTDIKMAKEILTFLEKI